jgi:hypothetical protein
MTTKLNLRSLSFTIVFVLLSSYAAIAQPDPGDDPDVPIDGGVSFLLIAGTAYGAKKIHENRKKAS